MKSNLTTTVRCVATVALLYLGCSPASALTIDMSGYVNGSGVDPYVTTYATISGIGYSFIRSGGLGGSLCAIGPSMAFCDSPGLTVQFTSPVYNLHVGIGVGLSNPGDTASVSWNGGGWSGYVDDDGNAITSGILPTDLTSFGAISILLIQSNSGSGAFTSVGGFSFDTVPTVTPVPVPAALPLLAAAVAGFGVMGRRKKKMK
jgi:hypothetical protein